MSRKLMARTIDPMTGSAQGGAMRRLVGFLLAGSVLVPGVAAAQVQPHRAEYALRLGIARTPAPVVAARVFPSFALALGSTPTPTAIAGVFMVPADVRAADGQAVILTTQTLPGGIVQVLDLTGILVTIGTGAEVAVTTTTPAGVSVTVADRNP